MLSKCPNCKSTFEIDEVQLTAADGLVRCGACLHVFNGRENLEDERDKNIQHYAGIDEELEAIWTGNKTAKVAMDSAIERGNALLRRFEQANK